MGTICPLLPHTRQIRANMRHVEDDFDLGPFAAWMRSWGAAETTIKARLAVVGAAMREWSPLTVTGPELAAWLGSPDFSPWTRVTYFSHLRCLFRWLAETGQREDDPTAGLRRPTDPKRKPRPLTPVQARAVLMAASGRDRTWLMLGMLAGLRAFEIAKIRGEDIDAEVLYVRGKGGVDAMLPTHPDLWALAQAHPRRGYWFPSHGKSGHVHPSTVSARITRLFTQLGIEGSSHRSRHTYGTNLLRNGENIRVVQDLMRHASLATTQAYLDVSEVERRDAISRLIA